MVWLSFSAAAAMSSETTVSLSTELIDLTALPCHTQGTRAGKEDEEEGRGGSIVGSKESVPRRDETTRLLHCNAGSRTRHARRARMHTPTQRPRPLSPFFLFLALPNAPAPSLLLSRLALASCNGQVVIHVRVRRTVFSSCSCFGVRQLELPTLADLGTLIAAPLCACRSMATSVRAHSAGRGPGKGMVQSRSQDTTLTHASDTHVHALIRGTPLPLTGWRRHTATNVPRMVENFDMVSSTVSMGGSGVLCFFLRSQGSLKGKQASISSMSLLTSKSHSCHDKGSHLTMQPLSRLRDEAAALCTAGDGAAPCSEFCSRLRGLEPGPLEALFLPLPPSAEGVWSTAGSVPLLHRLAAALGVEFAEAIEEAFTGSAGFGQHVVRRAAGKSWACETPMGTAVRSAVQKLRQLGAGAAPACTAMIVGRCERLCRLFCRVLAWPAGSHAGPAVTLRDECRKSGNDCLEHAVARARRVPGMCVVAEFLASKLSPQDLATLHDGSCARLAVAISSSSAEEGNPEGSRGSAAAAAHDQSSGSGSSSQRRRRRRHPGAGASGRRGADDSDSDAERGASAHKRRRKCRSPAAGQPDGRGHGSGSNSGDDDSDRCGVFAGSGSGSGALSAPEWECSADTHPRTPAHASISLAAAGGARHRGAHPACTPPPRGRPASSPPRGSSSRALPRTRGGAAPQKPEAGKRPPPPSSTTSPSSSQSSLPSLSQHAGGSNTGPLRPDSSDTEDETESETCMTGDDGSDRRHSPGCSWTSPGLAFAPGSSPLSRLRRDSRDHTPLLPD